MTLDEAWIHAADALRALHQTPPTHAEHHEWELRRDVAIYLHRELPHAPETAAADHALEEKSSILTQLLAGTAGHGHPEQVPAADLTTSAEALLQRFTESSDSTTGTGRGDDQPKRSAAHRSSTVSRSNKRKDPSRGQRPVEGKKKLGPRETE